MKIAFFDTKPYDKEAFMSLNSKYPFSIKFFEHRLTEDTVRLSEGYDVVCAFVNDTLNKTVLLSLYENGVKLVAMRCAGYNNVSLETAYEKIHIVRVPAYSPYAVAEHALALMLALNRKTHKAYLRTRESNFNIAGFTGFDMNGKTAAVIGTGKIGQVLISILNGLNMRVLAYDLYPNNSVDAQYTDLDTIYKESDIISLHCPLTPQTHHIIDEESISKMKDGVMLINTSRGALVDTKALIDALKTGKIGSAGLDVYEEESSYFFEDFSNTVVTDDLLARLLTFPNVLVTSHQAFLTKEALFNIAETTFENIKAFSEVKPLNNEVCYRCDKKECAKKKNGRCF